MYNLGLNEMSAQGKCVDSYLELRLSGNPKVTLTREAGKLSVDFDQNPLSSILIPSSASEYLLKYWSTLSTPPLSTVDHIDLSLLTSSLKFVLYPSY